jgi:hypothetical protein
MVPFSLMMARIVELDSNDQIQEVSDLWIKPNWKSFVTHDIDVEVSRIPIFANYELKIAELSDKNNQPEFIKVLIDQLDYQDEEARFFIMERDSWEKESSLLEKAGLDISKFIEETENEYLNPVIPVTFTWDLPMNALRRGNHERAPADYPDGYPIFKAELYQSGHFEDGEWISENSTRDRRPPFPFLGFSTGSSLQLEMSKETNSLMEVLRTTKIDYVEIPKESLEFFEDPDRATQKVTEITNKLDASKIQMIEDKINDVLRMKGDIDPWSRKVSLASPLSQKFRHGTIILGPESFDFDTKEARILQLQSKGRTLKKMHLNIADLGFPVRPSKRIFARVPSNWPDLMTYLEATEYEIEVMNEAVSDWKKVFEKAESNIQHLEEDVKEMHEIHATLRNQQGRMYKFDAELKALENELEAEPTNNAAKAKMLEIKDNIAKIELEVRTWKKDETQILQQINKEARRHRDIHEQLTLVAQILNQLQMLLAFYTEFYLILHMFKLEDIENPDVRPSSLDFLHTQLFHLGQSWTWGLEQDTLEQYQVPPKYRNKTMFEAYMSELNRMKDSLEKQRETRFEVESPYRNTPLRKEVLSFGQKSTILTELYLGTFEALSVPSSDIGEGSFNENRYCLIIDEPEVGRSEYSLNHLIKRLIWSKTTHDAELNNSVVVLSHRNKLLKQVSGKYHLLQPLDIGYQTEEE